jgi:peptidoglycan glycosyltransferase
MRKRESQSRRRNSQTKIFSTTSIFLLLFFIFIIVVVFRFIAIKRIYSSNENYIYHFNHAVYGELLIENNKTILKDSSNIEVAQSFIEKEQIILPPYAFFTLNLTKNKKAVYQLIPDKKKYTLSFFTRAKWFEIIGGNYRGRDGDSLVSLRKGDSGCLMIMNSNPEKNLYRAESLRVVALQSGYYYQGADGKRVEIPIYHGGSLDRVRDKSVWNSIDSINITKDGYISNGKEIIKINLGVKNKSVLVSKKPKKYNLMKARTLNISIVDKNTPSSKIKLVYADKGLYENRLSYNYVRIAHLLITYGIDNAKLIINKNIKKGNFLRKELMELVEKIDLEKNYYIEYKNKQSNMNSNEVKRLSLELLRYVEEGDYYRAKRLILMGADIDIKNPEKKDMLSMVLAHQKEYLTIPQEMKFVDNRLVIRGNKGVFGNSDYINSSHFATTVPIFDKPKIPQKEHLKVAQLNEFLNVTEMNGLFVSDENAKVYYSKTPDSFVQKAEINYRKSPPLFLYDGEKRGKFVAPEESIKGKFYYKIETKKDKLFVAFNGKITQNGKSIYSQKRRYNQIIPFYKSYPIKVKDGEVILEVNMIPRPLPCGVLFESKQKIDSLQYSYGWRNFKKFEIIERGDKYLYRVQNDYSKLFKRYRIRVKSNSNFTITFLGDGKKYTIGRQAKQFEYSPSLSCLTKIKKKDFLSLYDKENMMEIIPKAYQERGMKPKRVEDIVTKEIKKKNLTQDVLSNRLLPIYGDGVHYGLIAKGVKAEELTLDASFSKKVADIFEEVISPLKSSKNIKMREDYNTLLEGAVVVLEDKGEEELNVVAMYSYPYPEKLNLKNQESYKKEIFKYMLLNEFNNPKSSLRNRTLDMRIRPGSTFKIVTSIAGFKENIINKLDTKYRKYIEGKQDINGTRFKNGTKVDMRLKNFSFANGFTEPTKGATFKSSFKFSYNVYFGYLALLLNHKLDNGFRKELYPISNDKNIQESEFPLLRVANELQFNRAIYLSKKKKIFAYPSFFPNNMVLAKEVADSGIGQFEVAVTPMQMAVVVNAIRSRDIVIPRILKDEESQIIKKDFIDTKTQKEIKEAMRMVVSDKDGTAKCAFYHNRFSQAVRRANKKRKKKLAVPCSGYIKTFKNINSNDLNLSNIEVFGKTGTAEKGKGKLYDGWFVSFVKDKSGKKDDIIVVTVVRNSGTGGTYSATITKKIIEAWYSQKKEK